MTAVLRRDTDRDTQGGDDVMMEIEIEVLQNQGIIRTVSKPPEVNKRQGKILSCRFQKEHVPSDTFISDI